MDKSFESFPFTTKLQYRSSLKKVSIINLFYKKKNISIPMKTFGTSMSPFFSDGDIVYLKRINPAQLMVNDFITFKEKSVLITHRIIYKSQKSLADKYFFITKGDNNLIADKRIYPTSILGKVEKVNRNKWEIKVDNLYLIQSTYYFSEIVKFIKNMDRQKIKYVLLKGLPLHLYFENSHPKRLYADCDILVNKNDFARIQLFFQKEGYTTDDPSFSSSEKLIGPKVKECSFFKYKNGMKVEFDIHFEPVFLPVRIASTNWLYPQSLMEAFHNKLMSEIKVISIDGESFRILTKTNLIIYLSLHLFHHNYHGYYRYELLNNILKTRKVNYDLIAKDILDYKLQNFVYPVFLFLSKYYKSPIPKKLLKKIKPEEKTLRLIKENVLNIKIFDEELRVQAGTDRFKYSFYLSPNPFYIKVFIFLTSNVIYSVYFVLLKRTQLFYFRYNFFLKQNFRKFF